MSILMPAVMENDRWHENRFSCVPPANPCAYQQHAVQIARYNKRS